MQAWEGVLATGAPVQAPTQPVKTPAGSQHQGCLITQVQHQAQRELLEMGPEVACAHAHQRPATQLNLQLVLLQAAHTLELSSPATQQQVLLEGMSQQQQLQLLLQVVQGEQQHQQSPAMVWC